MSASKGFSSEQYIECYGWLGSYADVARELGVNESTVRRSITGAEIITAQLLYKVAFVLQMSFNEATTHPA